jgi:hypothetical protein
VLDTRLPPGTAGGPKVTCGQPRTFPVAGSCGIPATAQAVAFNVTVAQPSASGNLRLYPAGLALPGTSVLNFAAAETRSNNATALLGTAGQATVQCDVADSGDTHVVVDVFGYYEVVGVGPSLRSR